MRPSVPLSHLSLDLSYGTFDSLILLLVILE